MIRRWLLVLAAAAALAGCGTVMRVVYNNGDFALRVMANEYFDTSGDQSEILKAQLARFHEWHRREELPAYARVFQGAAERAARGLTPEDATWAIVSVRLSKASVPMPRTLASSCTMSITPWAKSGGVDGTFAATIRPAPSVATASVNVPPMSIPIT